MIRFAQRLTGGVNVKVKPLIKTCPTNRSAYTDNNSGLTPRGFVIALKRYVSPFKLLSIPAAHRTARMILTSSRFPVVSLFVFIFSPYYEIAI